MKNRLLLAFATFFLIAGVAAWLIKDGPPHAPITLPEQHPAKEGDILHESATQPHEDRTQPRSMPTPPGYKGLSDPRWKEHERKLLIDEVYQWKMPINFYGRVVDERMLPVGGAKIQFQWSDISENGASDSETLSDSSGRFELVGKTGNGVTIRVSKDGYYTPRGTDARSFENTKFWDANYYEPNPSNPVLFHLVRKGEGEMLIHGEVSQKLPPDGTPVRFDLLHKGQVSTDGQLEIAAVTNTNMNPPRFFDWRATVTVPEGGLMEINTEFPFEAPAIGYQKGVEFDMPAGVPGWRQQITKSYFIQFGTPPKYGRIRVRIRGSSQIIGIEYWVNPSGSRNLEPRETPPGSPR